MAAVSPLPLRLERQTRGALATATVTDVAPSVQAPDGRTWVVRRRFVPRLGAESVWGRFHRRFRQTMRRAGDAADADPGCLEVIGEGLLAALAVLLVIAVMVFILVPMLVAIVDIVVVALLALLGLAGRLVFRRAWTVEARAGDGACLVWRVVGWRASGVVAVAPFRRNRPQGPARGAVAVAPGGMMPLPRSSVTLSTERVTVYRRLPTANPAADEPDSDETRSTTWPSSRSRRSTS